MNILEQVRQTVAETLDMPPSSINEDSSAENIDAWDSLAQVNLMIALEQTFDVVLEVEDFMTLNSVAAIAAFMETSAET